tara:strand:+ start:2544 stop:2792 length:249 start_codon:yes stop_codon:yes gene_type:complete
MCLIETVKMYNEKIDELEIDSVKNGLLITNIGDLLHNMRGDIKNIRLLYISNNFDECFDLIVNMNDNLLLLQEIIQPDLLPM